MKQESKPSLALALISLVLGIVSVLFCIGLLTGIPAIITGHIARRRARANPTTYRGAGLGLAGLILGYLSLAQTVAILLAMQPAFRQAKAQAQVAKCSYNLMQIGMAVRVYANVNEGVYPRTTAQFGPHLGFSTFLVCPEDAVLNRLTIDSKDFSKTSYGLTIDGASEGTPTQVIARCPFHGNTLTADGAVHRAGASQGK